MPTILYADDDPENRELMHTIFAGENITLLEAIDGHYALEMIKKYRPDLLLLDLFMPRIDGFGVMKAVKANSTIAYLPIIVLSAWPTGDNRKRAEEYGAIDFIAKPYDPNCLIRIVHKHLSLLKMP